MIQIEWPWKVRKKHGKLIIGNESFLKFKLFEAVERLESLIHVILHFDKECSKIITELQFNFLTEINAKILSNK